MLPASRTHLLEEVQPDGFTLGPHPPRGQDGVDPSSGTDVEDRLAGLEHRVPDRVADPQGPLDRSSRDFGEVLVAVEPTGDLLAGAAGDRAVRLADGLLDLLLEHQVTSHGSAPPTGRS